MRTKSGYYRDQSKRDRTPYWGQVQKWVFKAKTREQWIETFNMLGPKEQYEILARFVPVPKQIQADVNSTFQLIINGLPIKSIDSKEVKGQLVEHQDDDD